MTPASLFLSSALLQVGLGRVAAVRRSRMVVVKRIFDDPLK
jgi:hypothetical protein